MMGGRYNTLADLQRRRDAWAAEIGQNNEWSHLAPQFVRELDAEIAALKARAATPLAEERPNK